MLLENLEFNLPNYKKTYLVIYPKKSIIRTYQ